MTSYVDGPLLALIISTYLLVEQQNLNFKFLFADCFF